MSDGLLTLAEVAKRLHCSIYTVKERLREANIRGPRPAREMMLTERDYAALVEHMRLRQRGGYSDPAAVKTAMRKLRVQQTRRLTRKHRGAVVDLNLDRPGK